MNRTDENIKKDIIDELYWDNRIDASQIKVTVENGIVTLSGKVPTYNDLSSARVAARRINGVIDVVDEMIVSYAKTPALPTDMEIKEKVEDILAWDPVIDEAPILISVKSGIVTLDGTVDAYWKKAAVENKISGIRGVLNIENKLAVVPTQRISDEVVAKDVMAAIDRDILVDPEDVTVEVTDGIVSLSGTIAGWTSRSAAEADAARTSGVIDVYNDLKIAY